MKCFHKTLTKWLGKQEVLLVKFNYFSVFSACLLLEDILGWNDF